MPARRSRSNVFGPTPGISDAGRSPTASSICSGVSTQNPSGLSRSDAIFASSLFGARPIEHTSPVSSLMRCFTRRHSLFGKSESPRSR